MALRRVRVVRVTVHAEDLVPAQTSPLLVLDVPCTVGEVAQQLPLKRASGLMILVNGKLARWDTALQDGDVVELIPVLGGG